MLRTASISTKFFLLVLLMLILNGVAYLLVLQNIYHAELRSQATTVVANVEAFGSWVAKHGRVWVKGDSEASFLSKVELLDPSQANAASTFYSKNPALAQREFSEVVALSSSPAKFRMTSHNVMNPVNKPDAFEKDALAQIGATNQTEFARLQDGEYRYAKAVFHTEGCIACHGDPAKAPADVISRYGDQNGFWFKEGDVAGIISVTIPAESLLTKFSNFVGPVELLLVMCSLLLALWFIRSALISPIKKLTGMAHEVSMGGTASIPVQEIPQDTHNEMDRLTVAVARMRNSTYLAIKKMREAQDKQG